SSRSRAGPWSCTATSACAASTAPLTCNRSATTPYLSRAESRRGHARSTRACGGTEPVLAHGARAVGLVAARHRRRAALRHHARARRAAEGRREDAPRPLAAPRGVAAAERGALRRLDLRGAVGGAQG